MKNIIAALLLTATTAACSSTHTTQVAGDDNVIVQSTTPVARPTVRTYGYHRQQQHPSRVCHRDTLRHYAFTLYREFNCYGVLLNESRRYH